MGYVPQHHLREPATAPHVVASQPTRPPTRPDHQPKGPQPMRPSRITSPDAPSFTRRDFEFIADLLCELNVTHHEACLAADMLADTNPLFRRATFIARACPHDDGMYTDEVNDDADDGELLWDDDTPTDELIAHRLADVLDFPTRQG